MYCDFENISIIAPTKKGQSFVKGGQTPVE